MSPNRGMPGIGRPPSRRRAPGVARRPRRSRRLRRAAPDAPEEPEGPEEPEQPEEPEEPEEPSEVGGRRPQPERNAECPTSDVDALVFVRASVSNHESRVFFLPKELYQDMIRVPRIRVPFRTRSLCYLIVVQLFKLSPAEYEELKDRIVVREYDAGRFVNIFIELNRREWEQVKRVQVLNPATHQPQTLEEFSVQVSAARLYDLRIERSCVNTEDLISQEEWVEMLLDEPAADLVAFRELPRAGQTEAQAEGEEGRMHCLRRENAIRTLEESADGPFHQQFYKLSLDHNYWIDAAGKAAVRNPRNSVFKFKELRERPLSTFNTNLGRVMTYTVVPLAADASSRRFVRASALHRRGLEARPAPAPRAPPPSQSELRRQFAAIAERQREQQQLAAEHQPRQEQPVRRAPEPQRRIFPQRRIIPAEGPEEELSAEEEERRQQQEEEKDINEEEAIDFAEDATELEREQYLHDFRLARILARVDIYNDAQRAVYQRIARSIDWNSIKAAVTRACLVGDQQANRELVERQKQSLLTLYGLLGQQQRYSAFWRSKQENLQSRFIRRYSFNLCITVNELIKEKERLSHVVGAYPFSAEQLELVLEEFTKVN
jgi:hypothetical protein